VTGRWLSKDPIGIAGGLNQYRFCLNNPICVLDPFGLSGTLVLRAWNDNTRYPGVGPVGRHAWVEFHPDNATGFRSYGTWGNQGRGNNGLRNDLAKRRGYDRLPLPKELFTRVAYLSDAQEDKFRRYVRLQIERGAGAWTKDENCGHFAAMAWAVATGEFLDAKAPFGDKYRKNYNSPFGLARSIWLKNGQMYTGALLTDSYPDGVVRP